MSQKTNCRAWTPWVNVFAVVLVAMALTGEARAQSTSAKPTAAVQVTPETFIRAETDGRFAGTIKRAGGVNLPAYYRVPTPLDAQIVMRMNRDTIYTGTVVDTSKGATITVPANLPTDRLITILVIDNDHYSPGLIPTTPGTHEIPADTKYMFVIVRLQVFDPKDAAELAMLNKLQDQFVIQANSADPMPPFKWDVASLKALELEYEKDFVHYSSSAGMMGSRGKVNEKIRHIGAATMWGLNADADAIYLNYMGGHDTKACYKATYQVPENKAFWSITVYGTDGMMKTENCILNSSTVKLNPDGKTFTAYFGTKEQCGDVPNRLDAPEGWNFLMRIYRPGPSVLDGTYQVAKAVAVK